MAIGTKQGAHNAKPTLQKILNSDKLVEKILNEAEHSMGREVSVVDMACISQLCDQIVEMAAYREELLGCLNKRMHSLAPNLTDLLGEVLAAKLIKRAGECVCSY
jgi:RNA processing factor Prp31